MNRLLLVLSLSSIAVYISACNSVTNVGGCEYTTTNGTCVFNQLSDGGSPTTFTFTPSGATAPTATGDLDGIETGDGGIVVEQEPSAACLAANHVTLNSSLPCSEQIETSGTCEPKGFVIPSFNDQASGCP